MKKPSLYLVAVLSLLALAVAACGGAAPAAPQPTAVPPTPTVAPTAASAAEPTAFPTLGPGVFTDALNKSKTVKSYSFDMQISGSGPFNPNQAEGTPGPGTPTPAPSTDQIPVVSMKGQVNGADTQMTIGGMMAQFTGGDTSKGLEIITAGDKAYIHGPIPMMGLTEDKWYEEPTSQVAMLKPDVDPETLFRTFTQTGMNPNDFKKATTESLDNQTCDVYVADSALALKTFQDLNAQSSTTGQAPNYDIDNADFRFWICPDGYLHQVRLQVSGHDKTNTAIAGSFIVSMHLSDINGNITITPPTDAVPIPTAAAEPTGGAPSGTPTP